MTGRIGLLGGECTGKSALAARLATSLPACVVPEAVRTFVEQQGRTPRIDEQRALMDAQRAAADTTAESCPHGVVVVDPAPLVVAVYSVLYFQDESLLDEAVADAAGYDLLLWCSPDIPWEPDPGVRDGPEYRERAQEIIASVVADRLAGAPVVIVTGSLDERLAQARRAWQTPGSQKPT